MEKDQGAPGQGICWFVDSLDQELGRGRPCSLLAREIHGHPAGVYCHAVPASAAGPELQGQLVVGPQAVCGFFWRGLMLPLEEQYRSENQTCQTWPARRQCQIAEVCAFCFPRHVSTRASTVP